MVRFQPFFILLDSPAAGSRIMRKVVSLGLAILRSPQPLREKVGCGDRFCFQMIRKAIKSDVPLSVL